MSKKQVGRDPVLEAMAAAMAEKRRELIALPLSTIWYDLALAAKNEEHYFFHPEDRAKGATSTLETDKHGKAYVRDKEGKVVARQG